MHDGMPAIADKDKNFVKHVELKICGGYLLMGTVDVQFRLKISYLEPF